ncbi:mixed-lineage leukemia protein, partial [Capsaspora owczarzaki ATCC 30864]|uniref:Mixed-lineage leukemia protein, variant n=1 Tax=Capsaspora owczarzaki (strain ATCC 30864) TaxID=595528 RepID=A0A0D2WJ18_CAPO3
MLGGVEVEQMASAAAVDDTSPAAANAFPAKTEAVLPANFAPMPNHQAATEAPTAADSHVVVSIADATVDYLLGREASQQQEQQQQQPLVNQPVSSENGLPLQTAAAAAPAIKSPTKTTKSGHKKPSPRAKGHTQPQEAAFSRTPRAAAIVDQSIAATQPAGHRPCRATVNARAPPKYNFEADDAKANLEEDAWDRTSLRASAKPASATTVSRRGRPKVTKPPNASPVSATKLPVVGVNGGPAPTTAATNASPSPRPLQTLTLDQISASMRQAIPTAPVKQPSPFASPSGAPMKTAVRDSTAPRPILPLVSAIPLVASAPLPLEIPESVRLQSLLAQAQQARLPGIAQPTVSHSSSLQSSTLPQAALTQSPFPQSALPRGGMAVNSSASPSVATPTFQAAPPKPRAPQRLERKDRIQITLSDLIDAGLLKPGTVLSSGSAQCLLQADSSVVSQPEGKPYASAQAWLATVYTKEQRPSMWSRVSAKGMVLNIYREMYIKRAESAGPQGSRNKSRSNSSLRTTTSSTITQGNGGAASSSSQTVTPPSDQEQADAMRVRGIDQNGMWVTVTDLGEALLALPLCRGCGTRGTDEETSGMHWCNQCCQPYHDFCVKSSFGDAYESTLKEIAQGSWKCWDCIVCTTCNSSFPEETLVVCDNCAVGRHLGCMDIPLAEVPSGRWLCSQCVKCDSCGAQTPRGMGKTRLPSSFPSSQPCEWMFDYSLCQPCGLLKARGNYCRVCEKVYEDDDYDTPMISCEQCSMWLHTHCVGMDEETYEMYSNDENLAFTCPSCVHSLSGKGSTASTDADALAPRAAFISANDSTSMIFGLESNAEFEGFDKDSEIEEVYSRLRSLYAVITKTSAATPFLHLPSRSSLPDYYKSIKTPMSLEIVRLRIERYIYVISTEMLEDVTQIVINALRYYGPKSPEAGQALEIRRNFLGKFQKLFVASRPITVEELIRRSMEKQPIGAPSLASKAPKVTPSPKASSTTPKAPKRQPETATTPARVTRSSRSGQKSSQEVDAGSNAAVEPSSTGEEPSNDATPMDIDETPNTAAPTPADTVAPAPAEEAILDAESTMVQDAPNSSTAATVATTTHPMDEEAPLEFLVLDTFDPDVDTRIFITPAHPTDFNDSMPTAVEDPRHCSLCSVAGDSPPEESGRLLSVGDLGWAHLNCAIWSSEVSCLDDGHLDGVTAALSRSRAMKCHHCGKTGATIGCAKPRCQLNYHFPCARHARGCVLLTSKTLLCPNHCGTMPPNPSPGTHSSHAPLDMLAAGESGKQTDRPVTTFSIPLQCVSLLTDAVASRTLQKDVRAVVDMSTALAECHSDLSDKLEETLRDELLDRLSSPHSHEAADQFGQDLTEAVQVGRAESATWPSRRNFWNQIPASQRSVARSGTLNVRSFGTISVASMRFSPPTSLYCPGFVSTRLFFHPFEVSRALYLCEIVETVVVHREGLAHAHQQQPISSPNPVVSPSLVFRVTCITTRTIHEGRDPESAWGPYLCAIERMRPHFKIRPDTGHSLFGLTFGYVIERLEALPDAHLCGDAVSRLKSSTSGLAAYQLDWPCYSFRMSSPAPPPRTASLLNMIPERHLLPKNVERLCAHASRCAVYTEPIQRDRFHFMVPPVERKASATKPGSLLVRSMATLDPSLASVSVGAKPRAPTIRRSAVRTGGDSQTGSSVSAALNAAGVAAAAAAAAQEASLDPEATQSIQMPMAMQYRVLRDNYRTYSVVRRSPIHGCGLYAARRLEKDSMVVEYMGERIRDILTDYRERMYDARGIGCYMFRIDDDYIIDATMKANQARFMNHSCEPNCYTRIVNPDGVKRIIYFASRVVLEGEELTVDYKMPIEDVKIPCYCGTRSCRGSMN